MRDKPIDSKDKPGTYRNDVRETIFSLVGERGVPLASASQFIGEWTVSFVKADKQRTDAGYTYHLHSDGKATVNHSERPPCPEDKWKLNSDGSLSLIYWTPPMPELQIEEPQILEIRMHAAILPNGSIVCWNGDGSIVEHLTRK